MATPEEIRKKLETQAGQRVNPLLKGLSMLTGGIAGEFTGTNEQIRQQRTAKRALMEEDLAALQEQRVMDRIKAQRQLMLEEDLKRLASEREANLLTGTSRAKGAAMVLGGTAKDFVGPLDAATRAGMAEAELAQTQTENARMQALKSRAPEMSGYLAQRGLKLGEPDVETLAFMEAQEKTKEAAQKEADRKKQGYMQFNLPGVGTIGGSPEQIKEISKMYPQLKDYLDNAGTDNSPFSSRLSFDPVTEMYKPVITFKPGIPIEKQVEITKQFQSSFGGAGGFPAEPAAGVKGAEPTKPTDIPGFTIKRVR
jgi:hypothetical protein